MINFTFDVHRISLKTIFLIGSFNALFFALVLLQKKPKALHDTILFCWLLFLALYTAAYSLTRDYLFTSYPLLSVSLISLLMLHGPFLYLYIESLATGRNKPQLNDLVHFIPFLCFNIYLGISAFIPAWSEGISLEHVNHEGAPPVIFVFFLILTAFSGPFYFLLSVKLFRKLKINLQNNYSFSEKIDPDWLRKLVIIFGIVWTALIGIAVIHHVLHYFTLSFCTDGLTLSLTVFIVLIGYFGLRQKEIFISHSVNTVQFVTEPSKKYSGSGLKDEDVNILAARLTAFMKDSKPYLNPGLTLPRLAEMLGIPSHHLSRVINEHFGNNFFDYINQYRVEEVKLRINESEWNNLTILGIAFDCGFNSKSAFNRLFRKYTGVTPSEYKSGQLVN